jgi:hypothetical protein
LKWKNLFFFFWKVIKLKKQKQKSTPVGVCWASAR